MSETLRFVADELQLMALAFMATVYVLRIRWLLKFKASRDRQPPAENTTSDSPLRGIVYSWANVAMPRAMESTRQMSGFYVQFVVFHLALIANITMSFVIPYAPGLMVPAVVLLLQLLFAAACAIGLYRLYRRISNPVIRLISTPDDYFSLALLTSWLFVSIFAAPNRPELGEGALMAYFIMTALFIIYVPFSKISHYLYYPFTRFYFGRTMGYRGVYPVKRVLETKSAAEKG